MLLRTKNDREERNDETHLTEVDEIMDLKYRSPMLGKRIEYYKKSITKEIKHLQCKIIQEPL